jgi:hypothetical protein
MLVDVLCLAFKTKPALNRAAVAALAATACSSPDAQAGKVGKSTSLCYTWDAQATCVTALCTVVMHRAKHGSYAAPVAGDVEKLMLEWLDIYTSGGWGPC